MAKQRKRKQRLVCTEHWQKMRKEALSVMPVWTRPLAGIKVNKMLLEKGFIKSNDECLYCDSGRQEKSEQS